MQTIKSRNQRKKDRTRNRRQESHLTSNNEDAISNMDLNQQLELHKTYTDEIFGYRNQPRKLQELQNKELLLLATLRDNLESHIQSLSDNEKETELGKSMIQKLQNMQQRISSQEHLETLRQ